MLQQVGARRRRPAIGADRPARRAWRRSRSAASSASWRCSARSRSRAASSRHDDTIGIEIAITTSRRERGVELLAARRALLVARGELGAALAADAPAAGLRRAAGRAAALARGERRAHVLALRGPRGGPGIVLLLLHHLYAKSIHGS